MVLSAVMSTLQPELHLIVMKYNFLFKPMLYSIQFHFNILTYLNKIYVYLKITLI